ncbi:MAG: CsbD family protein [Candidatus Dormibacteria bacterium]
MSALKNKTEGNIKAVAGRLTGDKQLEARGEGQKTVGEVEEQVRRLLGAVEEKIGGAKLAHRATRKKA